MSNWTKQCPYCMSKIDFGASVCPFCGREQPAPDGDPSAAFLAIGLFATVFGALWCIAVVNFWSVALTLLGVGLIVKGIIGFFK